MSVHSIQRKKRRDPTRTKSKNIQCHEEFVSRICRTLYYSELATADTLSLPITEVAVELFSKVKSGRSLDRLGLEEAASISRNACVSPASLVLALLYLDRLQMTSPQYLDQVTPPQLFLVSSLIASKLLNDDGEEDEVVNSEWAASADIPVSQLNQLEKQFLNALNWEVYIDLDEFWDRLELLEEEVSIRQAVKRGFTTYSDLMCLLHYIDSAALAQTLIKVGAVCLTAYAAGLASMVGSAALVTSLRLSALTTTTTTHPTRINQSYPHTISDDTECRLDECRLIQDVDTLPSHIALDTQTSQYVEVCRWWNMSWCHSDLQVGDSPMTWHTTDSSSTWRHEESSLTWRHHDQDNSVTSWFNKQSPFSDDNFILSNFVQPLYSYIQLVHTH